MAFVENAMVRQSREFKPMADGAKFAITEREQDTVIDCLSFGARSFTGTEVVGIGDEMSDHDKR
jgi:hypothetical protein